jgi:hypothetical protein
MDDTANASSIWPAYYDALGGRGPRPLFVAALQRLAPSHAGRQAIDLGSGDGAEAEVLLRDGWKVLAIDGEPDSKTRLEERISADLRRNLEVEILPFEDVEILPPADFI